MMGSSPSPKVCFEISVEDAETAPAGGGGGADHPIQTCDLCKRSLPHYKDIYMYRDRAFCSSECRLDKIIRNKREDQKFKSEDESVIEQIEKFQSRKKFRKLSKEDAKPLQKVQVVELETLKNENLNLLEDRALQGLEFVIGASTSNNTTRQRKVSSPAQVGRAHQKYSKQRGQLEKRKLKSSSEGLLSQDNNRQTFTRQPSSAEFSVQLLDDHSTIRLFPETQDHVISFNSNDHHRVDQVDDQRLLGDNVTTVPSHECLIDYKPDHQGEGSCKMARVEWTILLTTLILETSAATFDQVSSPSKPYYALTSVLISLIALGICVSEIVYKARKEKVTWRRNGRICWLYHPSPRDMPFGSLVDYFGLACAIVQSIFSIVEYAYFVHHANNPIKLCILPVIFAICLVFSKLVKNQDRNVPSVRI